jgi:hypothetical protein
MTPRIFARFMGGFAIVSLVLSSGCGSKDEPQPGEPVSGKISIKGKQPGTYCTVFFTTGDDSTKLSAGVDPTGMFSGRAPQGHVKAYLVMGDTSAAPRMGGSGGPGGAGFPKGGFPKGSDSAKDLKTPPKNQGASELSANAKDPNKSGVEFDVPAGGVSNLELKFDN